MASMANIENFAFCLFMFSSFEMSMHKSFFGSFESKSRPGKKRARYASQKKTLLHTPYQSGYHSSSTDSYPVVIYKSRKGIWKGNLARARALRVFLPSFPWCTANSLNPSHKSQCIQRSRWEGASRSSFHYILPIQLSSCHGVALLVSWLGQCSETRFLLPAPLSLFNRDV